MCVVAKYCTLYPWEQVQERGEIGRMWNNPLLLSCCFSKVVNHWALDLGVSRQQFRNHRLGRYFWNLSVQSWQPALQHSFKTCYQVLRGTKGQIEIVEFAGVTWKTCSVYSSWQLEVKIVSLYVKQGCCHGNHRASFSSFFLDKQLTEAVSEKLMWLLMFSHLFLQTKDFFSKWSSRVFESFLQRHCKNLCHRDCSFRRDSVARNHWDPGKIRAEPQIGNISPATSCVCVMDITHRSRKHQHKQWGSTAKQLSAECHFSAWPPSFHPTSPTRPF